MDKIDRFLDAIEYPERYTQSEIDAMLQDPEVKEMFDLLDKTKSSLHTITTPNLDSEWKRFEEKNRDFWNPRRNWLVSLFSRNAAASIAIVIASFTAVAAIVGVGIHHLSNNRTEVATEFRKEAEKAEIVAHPDSLKTIEVMEKATPKTMVFEDEPLEIILTEIAAYYECKVAFNNESSKSLRLYFRWNQDLTVEEIVDRLNNFEQIKLTIKDKTIKAE